MGGECSMYRARIVAYIVLVGIRGHLKEVGIDGGIKLRRIFKKLVGEQRTGLIWLRIGRGGGSWESLMSLQVP